MNDGRNVVMLVDDDAAVRSSLARLLSSAHLPFLMFDSAEDFLSKIPADARGCAVFDVHLPGMSGFALQEIVTREHPNVAVVIITGFDEEGSEALAFAGGAIAFLRKPFDAGELLTILRKSFVESGPR
jgi:FixJ family two-component response regulator